MIDFSQGRVTQPQRRILEVKQHGGFFAPGRSHLPCNTGSLDAVATTTTSACHQRASQPSRPSREWGLRVDPYPVHADRIGDVLDLLIAQIVKAEVQSRVCYVVDRAGDADAAWFRQPL